MDKNEVTANMRFRSTGLGATMLHAEMDKFSVAGDMLILHVNTVSPVRWHIRGGISHKGILKLIWAALTNFSVMRFLVFGFWRHKKAQLPDEF